MTTYWLLRNQADICLPSRVPPRSFDGVRNLQPPTSAPPAVQNNKSNATDSGSQSQNALQSKAGEHSKPTQRNRSRNSGMPIQDQTTVVDLPCTGETDSGSNRKYMSPKSPATSQGSVPRSPVGLTRLPAEQQEQAQKYDLQMNMPTPPGSLSRRRNNLDSPRDSRNPLRKLSNNSLTNCISSQGPPSEASSTYIRVDSPELPAVHFRNVKMGDGEERLSRAVQNDLFDSLKVGLDTRPQEKQPKNKRKKDTNKLQSSALGSERNTSRGSEVYYSSVFPEENLSQKVLNNEVPPPVPDKSRWDNLSHNSSVVSPSSMQPNSLHGRPVVPYHVSNPIVPMIRPTPLVLAGVSKPIQSPVRPAPCQSPRSVEPSNMFQHYHVMNGELPSIEEIQPEKRKKMNNILKELGNVVNPTQPNQPSFNQSDIVTYSAINKNKIPGKSEEKFVTAVYREPIAATPSPQKSPAPTPPHRGTPVQRSTPRTPPRSTPNTNESAQNGTAFEEKPFARLPPKPVENDGRRISDGSHHSSNSSQSTLTPTSGIPLVASIDGKMMSLLPPPPEATTDEEKKTKSLLKRSPSDSAKDKILNRKSVPQVKRSNSSPRLKPRGLPLAMKPNNVTNSQTQNLCILSDDEESVASHQMSENSSVVLLQPIELKLARPAYVRQISHPDHHVRSFIQNSDFAPRMDRQISRSSDTISSVPHGPPTPRFPLSTATSSSLTQLLQELASDHPYLDINIHKDVLRNNDSDLEFDCSSHTNALSEYDDLLLNGDHDMYYGNKLTAINHKLQQNGLPLDVEKASKKTNEEVQNKVNPFQVKRRHNYTIPPRHCRSLDYIPSDREEHGTSNQSSTCGSPKVKYDITPMQSYLLPFFNTSNQLGIESISMSSIASSSEMSKSDPALNMEVGSSAYESEYDNYRPGMTSDEDFFIPDPVSDMDIDIFDDVNVDNVTVSDQYSIDIPAMPVLQRKKITEV